MSVRRLNPRYIARKLGRSLKGSFDAVNPTGDYALLHLFNTDQVGRLQEVLDKPDLASGVGPDLIALVKAYLEKVHQEGQERVRCEVEIPRHVWDRYAKRAREERRRAKTLLVDAIVIHDERLQRAREGNASVVSTIDELRQHARQQGTALAALLMIAESQKWIPARLSEHLKKEGWL